MQNIDKYRQKEIGQYISCLATVGEQVDICTDVAYRLTLWYSDQIQSLAQPSKFLLLRFVSKHKPQTFSRVCLRLKRRVCRWKHGRYGSANAGAILGVTVMF